MKTNPLEECPPDEVSELDIKCRFVGGSWHVTCKQWKFGVGTQNLTRTVAILLAEIEHHNEYGCAFDWDKFCEREGLTKLSAEAQPTPPPKMFGRNKWGPIYPDDATRQPNHSNTSMWQRR